MRGDVSKRKICEWNHGAKGCFAYKIVLCAIFHLESDFIMQKILWLMIIALLVAGCRNSANQADNPAVRISIRTDPILPYVGDATVLVRLSRPPDNTPINDAQKIELKGDMTHAGMVPVFGETTASGIDGYYEIPLNFTMAGDWVISVTATLANGTVATYQASVAGVANVMPNFDVIEDCATPDDNSTETIPDCLLDMTEEPLRFEIMP